MGSRSCLILWTCGNVRRAWNGARRASDREPAHKPAGSPNRRRKLWPGHHTDWLSWELISRCPICSYRLRGLPDRHACPECGLQYDVHSTVFRESRRFWIGLAAVNGLILAAVVVRGIGRGWSRSEVASTVPFAVMMLVWLWRVSRARRLVVVSALDIVLIEGRKVQSRIPMSLVHKASWSFVNGDIHLRDSKRQVVAIINRGFLASDSRARALVREVKRLVGARASHRV